MCAAFASRTGSFYILPRCSSVLLKNKLNMQKTSDSGTVLKNGAKSDFIPVSVVIPTRNEARHLTRCLEAARRFSEIYVVDSQSTDSTVDVARSLGAEVVQFHYHGGWPKKRQWALDSLPFENDWVLLLDADEILTPELADEIGKAIRNPNFSGYRVFLQISFLGRDLRFGDMAFGSCLFFGGAKDISNAG